MQIDRMAQIALRRQGLGVKEKVVRFRGATVIFRHQPDGYDVLHNGVRIQFVRTQNIYEAIRCYKQTV